MKVDGWIIGGGNTRAAKTAQKENRRTLQRSRRRARAEILDGRW